MPDILLLNEQVSLVILRNWPMIRDSYLFIYNQEKRVKSLKRRMETWREFFVALYPLLTWAKPWYPAPIVGVISTLFL